MNRKIVDGVTVKYSIVPVQRYMVTRTSETEDAEIIEEIASIGDLLDARQMVRALTDYERKNPQEPGVRVLDFGDVEIH